MGDGELDEGNIWEAAMFAGNNKLHNLTAVIDRHNIQIDGMTEDIMPLEPVADKYRAFNWNVIEVDGNDMAAVCKALDDAKAHAAKPGAAPTMIVAITVPGKGVSFMEGNNEWHGRIPSEEEMKRALDELK